MYSPICTINPGGYSVIVKNGYSSISMLLLFIDGRKIAPPPPPVLAAVALRELPEK
jgi:hypothetical protein